ncbi:hypothetical protein EDD18DRAFT_1205386 [Armillaria luteobubalina]|uniref:Uncharacterized protein n=1 Tax=Armillaria luteobubalina TaxID=153913 RepID=A0AA39PAX6_9AGAR|nr:hypothetical protein EDD18DRAFT_1205386 [Armillaria luteobubalina]
MSHNNPTSMSLLLGTYWHVLLVSYIRSYQNFQLPAERIEKIPDTFAMINILLYHALLSPTFLIPVPPSTF